MYISYWWLTQAFKHQVISNHYEFHARKETSIISMILYWRIFAKIHNKLLLLPTISHFLVLNFRELIAKSVFSDMLSILHSLWENCFKDIFIQYSTFHASQCLIMRSYFLHLCFYIRINWIMKIFILNIHWMHFRRKTHQFIGNSIISTTNR